MEQSILSQMTETELQRYSGQIDNIYRGKGKVCLFASAALKELKAKSPTMKLSDASALYLSIFNQENNESVRYYIDGGVEAYILKKTELIMASEMNSHEETEESTSSVYQLKMKRGQYKDMTPAEIYNAHGLNALVQTGQELQQAINNPQNAKFKAMNTAQYQACVEAYKLAQSGQLQNIKSAKTVIIYEGIKTPDNKKVDKNGNTEVRSLSIYYKKGEADPYFIEISNCMAPPVQGAMVGAKLSQATDKTTMIMQMNERDFFCFWNEIVEAKKAYANYVASDRINFSEQYRWKPDPNKRKGPQNMQQMPQMPQYGQQYVNPYYAAQQQMYQQGYPVAQ